MSDYIVGFFFNPTDTTRVANSPRLGVGPGFDSQGCVTFLSQILLSQLVLNPLGYPGHQLPTSKFMFLVWDARHTIIDGARITSIVILFFCGEIGNHTRTGVAIASRRGGKVQ